MNRKGQALVEFILILPIFLLIILVLIDIGNIYIKKYELNKDMEIVSSYYEKNKNDELHEYVLNENIEFYESNEEDLKILTLKKEVEVGAPILSSIIGSRYVIETKKPILEDSHE